ncbi:MAG: tetratricopeptide repeat protein, partial [Planctomycetota bacterium]
MDLDRWQKVKGIFLEALKRTPGDRDAFLENACKGDASLRKDVEALLAEQEKDDGFLEPATGGGLFDDEKEDRLVGTQLGQYRLERLISAGGMGRVYEGLQEQPRRTVAVKVMRGGIASRSALRRFEYEAEILAHLSHPHIAQVFEAGTHSEEGQDREDGVPYFVMEYIPNARAITGYAEAKDLSVRTRLELFLQVCDAVHHGHQKGIIHRDLKPTNILVDESGQVKVIDFGVARATDSDIAVTTQTDVGQLLGTVQYMSPEQCKADSRDLDIRSDVYALGVVLYELLCGELPYDVRRIAVFEATRVICETEPKRPSTKFRGLKGDIETILLKALEKERAHRYQSVMEFSTDINRYLEGEVIRARPTGPATRAWKRIKRNPVVSGSIGIAALILIASSLYVLLWAYPQVLMERNNAFEARNEADLQREAALDAQAEAEKEALRTRTVNDFLEEMLSLPAPGQEGRDVKIAEALDKAVERLDEEFTEMPEIEASLRNTIGSTYFSLGQYKDAEPQFVAAAEIGEHIYGKEHATTLHYWKDVARVYKNLGRFDEAESILRKTIEILRRTIGEEGEQTLNTMNALGWVLETAGEYAEAESLLRKTLESQRRVIGVNHRDTIASMNLLATILNFNGKLTEAESLLREVLEVSRSTLDEDHPETLNSMNMLANVLNAQGKFAEAEEMHRNTLEARVRVAGEDHPDTLGSMNNLAIVLQKRGNYSEAESILRQIIEIQQRTLGEEHWTTLGSMHNLAMVLGKQGLASQAEEELRNLIEIRVRVLGKEHPDTLGTMNNLGLALYYQGRYDEAESIFKKVIE